MFGNLVTGCSVLAPAAMLSELSEGFGVGIATSGLLSRPPRPGAA
jgi:MFS transporter, DHA1 family, inner membrane transport protein